MAVLFSAVTVTAGDDQMSFLAGGIPKKYDDLEGWTAFDRFMELTLFNTDVKVHVDSYRYGEGEAVNATPEEIAYFEMRAKLNERFLPDRCESIGTSDFSFSWSADEVFGLEMK